MTRQGRSNRNRKKHQTTSSNDSTRTRNVHQNRCGRTNDPLSVFFGRTVQDSLWGSDSSLTNVTRAFIFLFICILLFSLWRYLHAAPNLTCHRLMLLEPTTKANVNSGHGPRSHSAKLHIMYICTNPSSVKRWQASQDPATSAINGTLLARDLRASVASSRQTNCKWNLPCSRLGPSLWQSNRKWKRKAIFVDCHNCQNAQNAHSHFVTILRASFRILWLITVTDRATTGKAWNSKIRLHSTFVSDYMGRKEGRESNHRKTK